MPECALHGTATGAAARPQLGLHLLLLHRPSEVNCPDTCFSGLNRARRAVSKQASRGEELSCFSLQERASRATDTRCSPSRCSIHLCRGCGTHRGTSWLRCPDRPGPSCPVRLEAQGKSRSSPNPSTASGTN